MLQLVTHEKPSFQDISNLWDFKHGLKAIKIPHLPATWLTIEVKFNYCLNGIFMQMMPLFTHCRSVWLRWSELKLKRLSSIKKRGMNIVKSEFSHSTDLRVLDIENQIKCLQSFFNCQQKNVCDPFMDYFKRAKHDKYTRNNHTAKLYW